VKEQLVARGRSCLLILGLIATACGNPLPGQEGAAPAPTPAGDKPQAVAADPGEVVTPPFAVQGELDGLLIVWFDKDGPHTAKRRSDVPEAQRAAVRIDSLGVAPDKRLDPDHVYIADLRAPAGDGRYPVRKHTRAWFDARMDSSRPAAAAESASSDVTIYMASWCGACRATASYLRSRNVPFVEKDIEKDAAANAEMQRKAQAAGQSPRGVPVIDFRGHLLLGFDRAAIDRLIAERKPT
jgi:glutaredoxin